MAVAPKPEALVVHVVPMRRRHVRAVLRIEQQVYPRPWTLSLFLSELALRSSRAYLVARVGRDVVGYGGLMMSAPPWARKIGGVLAGMLSPGASSSLSLCFR